MPTPSDTVDQSDTQSTESNSRSSFCPPEESREPAAQRQERAETLIPSAGAERASDLYTAVADAAYVTATEAISQELENGDTSPLAESRKDEPSKDARPTVEEASPSDGSPDVLSDSDSKLAQSMSNAAISQGIDAEPPPLYLHYSESERNRDIPPSSTTSFLRPGSKFRGTQHSDRQIYDVQVELKDVNLAESFLCGYLRIQGLTDDHPTLTTFFEGEIIGSKYCFRTSHPSWGSSDKVDFTHWARFPPWRPLAKTAKNTPDFTLKNWPERDYVFMRWKEYFLVPDHRVKTITGASFEGFYYICFDQRVGKVDGIYFHAKSEKYQQLNLEHVEDRGCMAAVDFR